MSIRLQDLPAASGVSGSDNILISQGGVAKLATVTQFASTKQDSSASLTALSALSGTGFLRYDGGGAFTCVTFTSAGVAMATAADVAAQRTLLGMGTSALLDVPASGNATSGQVVKGTDTRLSDSRAPTTHTHLLAAVTDAGTAAALNVPVTGDASSGQVVKGSDTRLTNTRTPAAHKSSHATGQSDALSPSDIGASATSHTHTISSLTGYGTAASRDVPASGDAAVGEAVIGSDSRLSDSRAPTTHTHTLSAITDAGTAAAKSVPATGDATSGQCVLGSDTRLTNARTPAVHHTSHNTGGSDAIAPSDIGASATGHTHVLANITNAGTAAAKNVPASGDATTTQCVLGADSRLSDSRDPTTHKASHATGGSDALAPSDIGAATTSHHTTHSTGGSDAIAPSDIGASATSHTHTPVSIGASAVGHTHVMANITDAGTMATQNAGAVAITGGSITGATISLTEIETQAGITPAANGTYASPTSITIVKGIITAIS